MSDLNNDLTGEALDASQLADELRSAHVKIEQLTQSLRQNNNALGHIAAAAGLLDFESLDELVAGVAAQLTGAQVSPPASPATSIPMSDASEVSGGFICEACGDDGAVDMDGAVLCASCNGAYL